MMEGETAWRVGALLIGVAFGACLERAGLGNANKLSAQFRGTDMSVTRVLFTALVTAALGIFWLDRIGVVDAAALETPRAFLAPQLLGGVLFGCGMALSGLCPGTACVALASGSVDGLVVIFGLLAGVLLFHEGWSLWEPLYDATALDTVTVDALLGLSRGVTLAWLVALALAAFAVAGVVERRSLKQL